MQIDLCGSKQLVSNFIYENLPFSDNFEIKAQIPEEVLKGELIEAVVRIKNITIREKENEDLKYQ